MITFLASRKGRCLPAPSSHPSTGLWRECLSWRVAVGAAAYCGPANSFCRHRRRVNTAAANNWQLSPDGAGVVRSSASPTAASLSANVTVHTNLKERLCVATSSLHLTCQPEIPASAGGLTMWTQVDHTFVRPIRFRLRAFLRSSQIGRV